nr:uncharacterized protein LOC106684746 [Halyomorpha halys]
MELEEGMYRSGFNRIVSFVTCMRGPLENPGKGLWYGKLYIAYITYIEFAVIVNWVTIGTVFLKPGMTVEVRCFTGFPVVASAFCCIRRVDMFLNRQRYKKLMEDYLSLYDNSPELNKDVLHYAKIIGNIPRILFFITALPMIIMGVIPILVAIVGGVRITGGYTCTLRALCFENMFNMFACRQLALIRQLSRELRRILKIPHVDDSGELKYQNDEGILYSPEEAKNVVIEELKQWVKNHQKSMRMAKELQDMYSISLCIQFAFTGLLLCTTAFVMANKVGGMMNLFFCGAYLIGLFIELLITCRIGDLILYESNMLERTVEGTHVYVLPSDVYKNWLRLILTRAKVPTRLSALGVFPLDMETYKSFIVLTYSFFTLLKELKHET